MISAFTPLTPQQLAPEAASLRAAILGSRAAVAERIGLLASDGSLNGPFDALLRTPQIGDVVQRLGVVVRSGTSLSPAVCETTILTVVGFVDCAFEWRAHSTLALCDGVLGEADIAQIRAGNPPASGEPLATAWAFALTQVRDRAVPEVVERQAIECFGERGVVELTVLVGYYALVCQLIQTCTNDRTEGVTS